MSKNWLEPHPTWEICDASKLQTYMECPRKYFYRYILGWETETDNVHLVFGEGWHRAMEHILLYGKSEKSIKDAFQKFNDYYREHFPDPYTDETRGNKVPASALAGLVEYCNYYKADNFEVLETEVAGTVPIDPNNMDRKMHFRIDAICKDNSGYFILEHKTASRDSEAWRNQWFLSTQVNLYIHTLFCLYNRNDIWGGKVNGVVFRKRDRGFVRVPIRKTVEGINNWLIQTQSWYDAMRRDTEAVLEEDIGAPAMKAFRMNTQNCIKYNTCKYHDLCSIWANPLRRAQEGCPMGFRVNWWNPADREKEARKVVNL